MKLESVGEVIAVREFEVSSDSQDCERVRVVMSKPQKLSGHEDYCCAYEISGGGKKILRYACGIDAFQAMRLTLSTIGVELEVLNKTLGGKLRWEGSESTLGFPDL